MPDTPDAPAATTAILVDKSIGDKEYFDHIRKVNDTYYDQIKTADGKAAYIFTFLLAFLISSAEGRSVFRLERYQSGDVIAGVASGLLAVAVTFSAISAILVVLPRVRATATSLFWGVWPKEREKLIEAHKRMDQDYLFREYVENATNLALIAGAKYRFVSFAFRGLIVTVLSYVLVLILE